MLYETINATRTKAMPRLKDDWTSYINMLNEDKGYRGGLVAHILRGTTTSMTTARTTYKPRGKIDHNSTRTRNLATKMDMLMILKSEDLALHNNQMFETRHYTTIIEY